MPGLGSATDGLITIRPPATGDARRLVEGRDEAFHRFLGDGQAEPDPTACVLVGKEVVGWVDYDTERSWLEPGEVNVGYHVFAAHRGAGYASRAVRLLLHRLAIATDHTVATLLMDPANHASLALAERTGFRRHGELDGNEYWKSAIPGLTYADGVVTIRRPHVRDLGTDLEPKDEAQIDWMWLPGEREAWEAMDPVEQRAHALAGLEQRQRHFGSGPKWTFTVDAVDVDHVAYVDCDLGNEHVPAGEANISYSAHPAHRGNGYVSRAVRLVTRFLRDHTGARTAHIVTDEGNEPSRRVADAVGAVPRETWIDGSGRTMIRHVLTVR